MNTFILRLMMRFVKDSSHILRAYERFYLAQMGFMHVTRLRYGPIKTFITYLQEGLPLQLKQIHMLNVVSCVDKFMRIISPLLKPHVNEMVSKVSLEMYRVRSKVFRLSIILKTWI